MCSIMTGPRCRAGVPSLRLGCAYARTDRGWPRSTARPRCSHQLHSRDHETTRQLGIVSPGGSGGLLPKSVVAGLGGASSSGAGRKVWSCERHAGEVVGALRVALSHAVCWDSPRYDIGPEGSGTPASRGDHSEWPTAKLRLAPPCPPGSRVAPGGRPCAQCRRGAVARPFLRFDVVASLPS
jgi:hypothetical protein